MRTLVRILNPLYFLSNLNFRLARKGSYVSTAQTGQKNEIRTSKTDGVVGGTGDTTRNKCIELIYDGLACDATARTYVVVFICVQPMTLFQPSITFSPKLEGSRLLSTKPWAVPQPNIGTKFALYLST